MAKRFKQIAWEELGRLMSVCEYEETGRVIGKMVWEEMPVLREEAQRHG